MNSDARTNPADPSRPSDELLLDWALGQLHGEALADVERALTASPSLCARAEAIRRALMRLDHDRVAEPSADLADRICASVARARSHGPRTGGVRRPSVFSLAEIAVVAASLLLMALIFFPPVRKAQYVAQQRMCQDNMRRIGVAMEQYASESSNNALPFVPVQGNWLQRDNGRRASGTAPLFLLVRQGKIQPKDVICPGSDDGAFADSPAGLIDFPQPQFCSYSFQNMLGATEPIVRGTGQRVPVLADRNPLFRTGRFVPEASGNDNSHNHGGDGQNVLFNDGRVLWVDKPLIGPNDDNIWLAGSRSTYTGIETRTGPDDAFLAP